MCVDMTLGIIKNIVLIRIKRCVINHTSKLQFLFDLFYTTIQQQKYVVLFSRWHKTKFVPIRTFKTQDRRIHCSTSRLLYIVGIWEVVVKTQNMSKHDSWDVFNSLDELIIIYLLCNC